MQRAALAITSPHFFLPIPTFITESKSYIINSITYIAFQSLRNASNTIIKFLDYVSYFYTRYYHYHSYIIYQGSLIMAEAIEEKEKTGSIYTSKEDFSTADIMSTSFFNNSKYRQVVKKNIMK